MCGPALEVTVDTRASIVATFTGDRSLGVPGLETYAEREAWVDGCLQSRPDWPAACDLRAVVPFDARWWDGLPTGLTGERQPVSLHEYGDHPEEPPCSRSTLVWVLTLHHPRMPWDNSGLMYTMSSVRFDAHTGAEHGRGFGSAISGRPFVDRLPAVDGAPVNGPAAAWVERAREEHASIASFARHTLELLSLGAPMDLVEAVARAQHDEIRHALLCLERAAAHGAAVRLSLLDTAYTPRTSAFDIAIGVALEGCVNETLAALGVQAEAAAATGREQEVLASIAEDEAEHACLAWRTLAWLMPRLTRREQRRLRAAMHRALPVDRRSALRPCVDALAA